MSIKIYVSMILAVGMLFAVSGCSHGDQSSISSIQSVTKKTDVSTTAPELLKWPDSKLARLLPQPSFQYGKITDDKADSFEAIIKQVSPDDFESYVKACADKGFDIDYDKSDSEYTAKIQDGYTLTISYSNESMTVSVKETLCKVAVEVQCIKNLMFSQYDVELFLDDISQGVIEHGGSKTFHVELKKGTHKLLFKSTEDSDKTGEASADIAEDCSLKYELYCTRSGIDVTDNTEKKTAQQETSEPETKVPESSATEESVSYSTNTSSTVKNGNSGVYSYRSRGGTYYIYYIIDFDEGCVYYFTDGNGEEPSMRTKIDSGDLNHVLMITYHDGSDVWSEGLHFKYENQPNHLIMQDHNGFTYDFFPTDLIDALALRDKKGIKDY